VVQKAVVKAEKVKAVVKKEVVEQVVKKESPKPIFTVSILDMTCTMHRTSEADEQTVPLQAGPKGLLMAKFGVVEHTTELCNLMLAAAPKPKPKKEKVQKKKPAAAPPVVETPLAEAAAAPVDDAPVAEYDARASNYSIMYYGTNGRNNIGIKEKLGAKKQIVYFGGKTCTKSKEQLKKIAELIVGELSAGMSAEDATEKGQELADAD